MHQLASVEVLPVRLVEAVPVEALAESPAGSGFLPRFVVLLAVMYPATCLLRPNLQFLVLVAEAGAESVGETPTPNHTLVHLRPQHFPDQLGALPNLEQILEDWLGRTLL